MAQIFISAGHGGLESGVTDPGVVLPNTTEAEEMIQIRDLVVAELRSRSFAVLWVPDDLSAAQTLAWINARCRPQDVALEIHGASSVDPTLRGSTVFYIAKNDVRRTHAELVVLALLRRAPQLISRGVKPDTDSPTGQLPFCRNLGCPSLLMEVGHLTNAQDLAIIQQQRRDVALGIADGLASWSRAVAKIPMPEPGGNLPEIRINLNGGIYPETGIIYNSNSYVPIDIADLLGVDATSSPNITRIRYANVVYIKAVDLQNYNVSVSWEAASRTLRLRSRSGMQFCPGSMDRIMGIGSTSETQLTLFLQSVNPAAANTYRDLPKLYREEAAIEGSNHDIAFCQMLVETNSLNWGGSLSPGSNNFGGIGSPTGGIEGASFPSARVGVRAQVQHLKAYASLDPLVQRQVDPRFGFVVRGVAPLVSQLTGRWNADPEYGRKIGAFMRRLYESAGLL
ncbi:N-acetylmuramoyl-L-alanine amidase [Nodosilinea sp. LEGE 07088]|uniref:hormogonium tapered terminus morphoprotein TftA n=1 Tax=Nodosilinea sp. LEGE 07088 TaxID=2777968 RepID=UPI001880E6DE|nr:N-acetylmuramoyl-L-alanine amidase [Nodosilinea sp. LEGE 07088]MBE9139459.1 N-acetylmuramoyl-L-alanine amidase [Nodosilinea sp. LEGE 07088]